MRVHAMTARPAAVLLCCFLVSAGHAAAQRLSVPQSPAELKKLSIEQLMTVQVTSASRREEALGSTAAALTVVTGEDIRRSGATSVPEALRLVPGIHVARQTSSVWAISSRGFSSVSSEKLLVLSDTRSIYTPLFSGVLWDAQNYLLQDIDRIEVIRGPGATLWGSNAVNGVINITTKHASETQGLYVSTTAGTEERAGVAARYGGRLAQQGYYRVFARYIDRDGTFVNDQSNVDDWQIGHVGFRTDWASGAADTFTVQGDLYRGDSGQVSPAIRLQGRPGPQPPLRVDTAGGNLLARWRHQTSNGSDLQVRAYYDRTHRDDPSFLDDLDTVDVDLLHRFDAGSRHGFTWGANYRFTSNRNRGRVLFALDPPDSRDAIVSGFIQDEVELLESVQFTAGTKLEHNDFSGFEIQPSARVTWDVSPNQTVWGAVSRAVRVPTRLERDIAVDASNPGDDPFGRLLGNDAFDAERLIAYEAGYRWQVLPSVFLDVAGFHNRYNGLASLEFGEFAFDPAFNAIVVPIRYENLTDGHATGVETLVTLTPMPWWRVSMSSSYLEMELIPNGMDLNSGRNFDDATPRHQLGVRSYLDLPRAFQLDALFRHFTEVRRLPFVPTGERIPAYAELDVRVAWRGWRDLELSIVGQNLLHDRHVEFGEPTARGEIERGVYARAAWGF
jgi:iron complex outermembrane receptor protein